MVFTEPPFQLLTSLLFYYVYDEDSRKRIKVRACEGVFLIDKWGSKLKVEPINKWDFNEQTYRLNENALMKVYEIVSKSTGLTVSEVQEFVNDFSIICELLNQAYTQNPTIDTFIEDKLSEPLEFRQFISKPENWLRLLQIAYIGNEGRKIIINWLMSILNKQVIEEKHTK